MQDANYRLELVKLLRGQDSVFLSVYMGLFVPVFSAGSAVSNSLEEICMVSELSLSNTPEFNLCILVLDGFHSD